jgi:hypothetical protein
MDFQAKSILKNNIFHSQTGKLHSQTVTLSNRYTSSVCSMV